MGLLNDFDKLELKEIPDRIQAVCLELALLTIKYRDPQWLPLLKKLEIEQLDEGFSDLSGALADFIYEDTNYIRSLVLDWIWDALGSARARDNEVYMEARRYVSYMLPGRFNLTDEEID